MRVTTAFNRLLVLPGASVADVAFTDEGVVVGLRRRARLHRCPCGHKVAGRYDRSRRRWRHLDLAIARVWLEAELARIWCPRCRRVRTEDVPWARPGARHSRDFEDIVAWLAQRMDKTSLSRLMRCSWAAVHRIVSHVVTERLSPGRLEDLYRIGVDEISYKRGHRYLSVVTDHDTGRVVWVGTGRSVATLQDFYAELGPERCEQLEAVTMDGAAAYIGATRTMAPNATICFDAFHVIKWANEALDGVFAASDIAALKTRMKTQLTTTSRINATNVAWRRARYAVRAGKERLGAEQRKIITLLRSERADLHRAWLLKEELRDLFQIIDPGHARAYLRDWTIRAARSGIRPFINLANKIAKHFDGIVAAVELGLSNSRSEGINTKIRVIQRRGYGHPNPASLTAMIYLCCSGMNIPIPTQT